jgi:hypothetical protein
MSAIKEHVNAVNTILRHKVEEAVTYLDGIEVLMTDGQRDREGVKQMIRAVEEIIVKMKEVNEFDL